MEKKDFKQQKQYDLIEWFMTVNDNRLPLMINQAGAELGQARLNLVGLPTNGGDLEFH